MKKILVCALVASALQFGMAAQSKVSIEAFKPVTDSLETLFEERTTVRNKLILKKVIKQGETLDLYFDNSLGDYPWRENDVDWFRKTFTDLLPSPYKSCTLGIILSKKTRLEDLTTPELGNSGKPSVYKFHYSGPARQDRFVRKTGAQSYPKGLSGRIIALWQSHGRIYDPGAGKWVWQRPAMHRTVEDLYTQSYVLPFLIPMLENAGAYIIDPRERDTQKYEVITDNDPSFDGPRELPMRQKGDYREKGGWTDAGQGFADTKPEYLLEDNPFIGGTARKAACVDGEGDACAEWEFKVPERGRYAVYVSYKTLPNSSDRAHYVVKHLGGESGYLVNQSMGGGTWIYLGTFEFDKDGGKVTLDNGNHSGEPFAEGRCVSADALKVGGGMGKVLRGKEGTPVGEWTSSGMPSFAEGALYSMVWSGIDTSLTAQWEGDYTRDFASRGAWTEMMAGGSAKVPDKEGKKIPVDLSLGFHSDAGTTPNDTIVGTLAIYTLMADTEDKKDKTDKFPDGRPRTVCRHYADLVQSQIVNDVREYFSPEWTRRYVWDRSYSESRTTGVPAMLLELLSHQNFADMRFGLDPAFKFTVCRAVYKGMLKFLSDLYAEPYVVQPLPVNSFAARLEGDNAILSWKETKDVLEPTAGAKGFTVFTRIDDGSFDEGHPAKAEFVNGAYRAIIPVRPGHIYSFRIAAYNEGGMSFQSETLSVGKPAGNAKATVMVINNFDRVSGPTWFDTPEYAGFEGSTDAGMPYMSDISFVGDDYQHRRDLEYQSNDNPGFGASRQNMAGHIIPGNTFDYPYVHGKALLDAGYAFYSASRNAWMADNGIGNASDAADIICGKQVTTVIGDGSVPDRYQVFPTNLQKAISQYVKAGRGIVISGADIATDVWDRVYPVQSPASDSTKTFVQSVLGYGWASGFGSIEGSVYPVKNKSLDFCRILEAPEFWQEYNDRIYRVENPDGIKPAGKKSSIALRYTDTDIPAAVNFDSGIYRVVSFGFPLETLKDTEDLKKILDHAILYCKKK